MKFAVIVARGLLYNIIIIIAKMTVYTPMYKTKINKPCINFCNLRLTATLKIILI